MINIEEFAYPKTNIKPRSAFRDSKYHVMRDTDKTKLSDDDKSLFDGISETFEMAFAVGYHFNKKKKIAPGAINHVNVGSTNQEFGEFKELAVLLVLKRNPSLNNAEDVWKEISEYAEYGIEAIFAHWEKNKVLDIDAVLEK